MQKIITPHGLSAWLTDKKSFGGEIDLRFVYHIPLLSQLLVWLTQVHGHAIIKATHAGHLGQADGILLDRPHWVGMILVADCNGVIVYDKKKRIVCLLHAGRLGVQKNILQQAVWLMAKSYQSQAKDLWVYVSPSIRVCCYEVGEEVFVGGGLDEGRVDRNGRIYLNLLSLIQKQCLELGIRDMSIHPSCSCCDERFFSYRRENTPKRFGLFVRLD